MLASTSAQMRASRWHRAENSSCQTAGKAPSDPKGCVKGLLVPPSLSPGIIGTAELPLNSIFAPNFALLSLMLSFSCSVWPG